MSVADRATGLIWIACVLWVAAVVVIVLAPAPWTRYAYVAMTTLQAAVAVVGIRRAAERGPYTEHTTMKR